MDVAYRNYFNRAAQGQYDSGAAIDRLRVCAVTSAVTGQGAVRLVGRVINLVVEVAKVLFYSIACLCTAGKFGNAKRLKSHVKLFALNNVAIAAQTLQLVTSFVAIGVGIISPKASFRMMQVATCPLAEITSSEQKIWQGYKFPKIYKRVFHETPACEVPYFLKSAHIFMLGIEKRFHLFGANPQELTEEQKKMRPIILLHGNGAPFTNQSTWIPLLHALEKLGNKRPVYTINLPSCPIHSKNFAKDMQKYVPLVDKKFKEIAKQYGGLDGVDMVGHSLGSQIVQWISFRAKLKIGRAITVGTPLWLYPCHSEKIFDVTGRYDSIYSLKSRLLDKYRKEIKTGHVGLVFHHKSLQAIQQFLNA